MYTLLKSLPVCLVAWTFYYTLFSEFLNSLVRYEPLPYPYSEFQRKLLNLSLLSQCSLWVKLIWPPKENMCTFVVFDVLFWEG